MDRLGSARAESPIEDLMLAALVRESCAYEDWGQFSWREEENDPELVGAWYDVNTLLYCQMAVNGYRVDLLVATEAANHWLEIVVELDGHDFHERTKEQAQRDKARDRAFTTDGIPVLRFTGSEVWRDAAACARQVLDMVAGLPKEASCPG